MSQRPGAVPCPLSVLPAVHSGQATHSSPACRRTPYPLCPLYPGCAPCSSMSQGRASAWDICLCASHFPLLFQGLAQMPPSQETPNHLPDGGCVSPVQPMHAALLACLSWMVRSELSPLCPLCPRVPALPGLAAAFPGPEQCLMQLLNVCLLV